MTTERFLRARDLLLRCRTDYDRAYAEREKTESGSYVQEYVNHFLQGEPSPGIAFEHKLVQTLVPAITAAEVTGETLIRQVWDADFEAFQDHWGGSDSSEESLRRFLEDPNLDPSLWVIAWDGDEVAGGVINAIEIEENAMLGLQQGWLHSVFTRRQWRKRGLANALINRSLEAIRDRGMDTGILGVDADNPTGALGLYERNGFVVAERSTAWRRPLDL